MEEGIRYYVEHKLMNQLKERVLEACVVSSGIYGLDTPALTLTESRDSGEEDTGSSTTGSEEYGG